MAEVEPLTDIDIDALVRDFANDLSSSEAWADELAAGGGSGSGNNNGGSGGGGGGGGGDDNGSGNDPFDEEQFYADMSKKLSKKLSKEEQEALVQSMGIALDKLPFTPYGHAIRMFNFAEGHLMRRTASKSRTGEWIMYRPETGTWSTEAADDLILNRAMQVAFMLRKWAMQMGKMIDDAEASGKPMSDAKQMVLGVLMLALMAESLEVEKKLSGIIRMARSIDKHHINYRRFDTDHMKLAVANGVIDLRTGERLDPSPTNYITRHIDTGYFPNAKAPTWIRFVEQAIPDPEVRHWVQRFAGYCLTGDVDEQVACFFHGTGGTGKSTFWNVIREVLGGEFASQVHRGVFHKDDFTRYASATIIGLRLGIDSEWENQEILLTGKFRQLVGERSHTPEPKMQKLLGEMDITAKFVFLCQHLPWWDAHDVGTSEAMRRRMFIVPMNQRLARNAYTSRAYLDLMPNLLAEREGILAWLVKGEQMRHVRALHMGEPQAMADARTEYFKALGAIVIDEIQEALMMAGYRLDPTLTTTAAELSAATGIEKTALGRWLGNHGCVKNKSGTVTWRGIGK